MESIMIDERRAQFQQALRHNPRNAAAQDALVQYARTARAQALKGDLPRKDIAAELKKAGITVTDELLDGLLAEAHDHAERRALEDEQRARISTIDNKVCELTRLADGMDLGGLYELALDLRDQGF